MRVWDSLFFLLVILPIVTGGIWFSGEGWRLEYTQPGAAAAVLLFLFLRLLGGGRGSSAKSIVIQKLRECWELWTRSLEKKPFTTLSLAAITVAALWFLTSLFRHRAFGSGLADLGIFTNGIWNVHAIGFPYSSIKDGLSLLADHQNFLIYPLGWIFGLWPSPAFLFLLQAIALASGGIALYLLCRQRLGPSGAAYSAWAPITYWACGPLRAAGRFDFHPEVLMLPFFLFAAFLLQEKKAPGKFPANHLLGLLFFFAALAAKESAGPVACGLGLAWLLGAGPENTRRFTRGLGGVVILLGISAFLFDSRVVPSWYNRSYAYGDLYAPFGASPLALALAPFTQPLVFFGRLFSPSRIKFFLGTMLPLGFLPALVPLAALAAAPGFLMLFLTNGDHRISLGYHYAIEPLVGLFFALPPALAALIRFEKNAENFWNGKFSKHVKLILPCLGLATLFSYGRSELYFWRVYGATAHQAWLRDEVLPNIHADRMVSASYALVPHLSTRQWIHQVPILVNEFQVPVDCVAFESTVNNTPMSQKDMTDLKIMLNLYEYSAELECGTFTLYRKKGIPSPCLTSPVTCGGAG